MAESDSEGIECTPPEIREAAQAVTLNLLPEKSKKNYELVYASFMDWRTKKKSNSFSENNLLAYFMELSEKYKSSSLWTTYSMLKSTLNIHHNINIETYSKLRSFLKRQSDGYKAKKAAVFTPDQIHQFMNEAPNDKYLATKVALIMGAMGCCRAIEMYKMKLEDLQDCNPAFLVNVPDTKTKVSRQFSISGPYYEIVKKYIKLRPSHTTTTNFFLNFQKGKCTVQTIGINKFRNFGKDIAKYLKLPNVEKYTGHSFRRSSATILSDSGATLKDLKFHGGWKSDRVAEDYIERSTSNKLETAKKILSQVQPLQTHQSNHGNLTNNGYKFP